MPFERHFNEILKKTDIPPEKHLWQNSIVWSLITLVIITGWIIYSRGFNGLGTLNSSTAWVAVVFIGLSMLLSGLCYFWDYVDTKIIYRKHIGVIGFVYAAIHGFISLVLLSNRYPFPEYYLAHGNIIPFLFAVASLLIFAFMASISNKYAVKEIGGKGWRRSLRLGYIAYVFAIFHFGLKGFSWWIKWIESGMKFPPPIGFILFWFAVFVIYFRVILELDIRMKKS